MIDNKNKPFEFEWDKPDAFRIEKYCSTGYRTHLHRNTEIYGVVDGTSHAVINDREYDLTNGQILTVSSLQFHSYTVSKGTIVFYILLGETFIQNFNAVYPNRSLPEFLDNPQKNYPILQLVNELSPKSTDFDTFEKTGYSNILFHHIVSQYGTQPAVESTDKRFVFQKIIQYIYDNYAEDLSLEQISQRFNYAPRTIGHMFNKYLNIDIRNFINNIRVEKVNIMKNDPAYRNEPIINLALACGINSISSYYRACQKIATPPRIIQQ